MPQRTFRQPSSSTLDRTQSDPAASDITPKLKFSWRRDGKLSKDLVCYLSGKTTNLDGGKARNREPDITISIFKGLREITLYEPHLYRVEMEDFKGLEVVLMLGAVVIRDVFFGPLREAFNVSDPPQSTTAHASPNGRPPLPRIATAQRATPSPPPADPRTQWEIDAENARLRQQQEAEARERQKRAEDEERKTKKLLEAEQKAARKKQADVARETERLKRIYGREERQIRQQQASRPPMPPRPPIQHHQAPVPAPVPVPPGPSPYLSVPGVYGRTQSAVQFVQPRPHSSTAMSGACPPGAAPPPLQPKRSSFFGLRRSSEDNKLTKKRSSMF
ncbi:hypothetical protein VTN02DRAFT_524 [Thermoascus thermophilus]